MVLALIALVVTGLIGCLGLTVPMRSARPERRNGRLLARPTRSLAVRYE